jgi:hypothetical protein
LKWEFEEKGNERKVTVLKWDLGFIIQVEDRNVTVGGLRKDP